MGIKVNIAELPQILKKKIEDVKKATHAAQTNTAMLGVGLSIHETSTKPKPGGKGVGAVDRGLFKNSWFTRQGAGHVEIRNNAPYASDVEIGSRPHRVNFLVLLAWVNRKKDDIGIDKDGVYPVAKAIQKKIAREGTKPMFIAKGLIPELTKTNRKELEALLRAIAARK